MTVRNQYNNPFAVDIMMLNPGERIPTIWNNDDNPIILGRMHPGDVFVYTNSTESLDTGSSYVWTSNEDWAPRYG